MNLFALGLNHNTAPLALREKVAFSSEELDTANQKIRAMLGNPTGGGIKEVAILSTCNRTEIYCAAEDSELASKKLKEFLAESKGVKFNELEEHLYVFLNDDAARHAFRVASGLDSMVLGETQIVGQMKKAVKTAQKNHGLGVFLNYLFQKTFAVAKEVRSKTEIGAHSVSLAAAGVRVASSIFGSLENSNILFVGAGEMIELCAAHFCAQKPKNIAVANRTVARAAALAETIGAKAVGLVDLPEILPEYDILITCTASTLPIIGLGMVQSALKRRKHRPIFMIDLAVPRDIEREVDDLDEVYVYTVDDLGKVVQSGIQGRKAAVEQADRLIETKVDEFKCWMTTRSSIPQILSLQERADALRMMELEKAKKAIQKGGDANEILEAMSHGLMKKFIHDPLTVLRNDPNLSQEDYEKVLHLLDRFYHYHIHHR